MDALTTPVLGKACISICKLAAVAQDAFAYAMTNVCRDALDERIALGQQVHARYAGGFYELDEKHPCDSRKLQICCF